MFSNYIYIYMEPIKSNYLSNESLPLDLAEIKSSPFKLTFLTAIVAVLCNFTVPPPLPHVPDNFPLILGFRQFLFTPITHPVFQIQLLTFLSLAHALLLLFKGPLFNRQLASTHAAVCSMPSPSLAILGFRLLILPLSLRILGFRNLQCPNENLLFMSKSKDSDMKLIGFCLLDFTRLGNDHRFTHPMDFATRRKKLAKGLYVSLKEFEDISVADSWFELLSIVHMMAMMTLMEANSKLIPDQTVPSETVESTGVILSYMSHPDFHVSPVGPVWGT
ncbi:putative chromatin remodeler Bromodomain family [Helianthus anomalus]